MTTISKISTADLIGKAQRMDMLDGFIDQETEASFIWSQKLFATVFAHRLLRPTAVHLFEGLDWLSIGGHFSQARVNGGPRILEPGHCLLSRLPMRRGQTRHGLTGHLI